MRTPDRDIELQPLDLDGLRIPPHSMEAESSLLGALLLDNEAWDQVAEMVSESDFYRHEHRFIFRSLATLIGADKPADVITVFEELRLHGKEQELGGLPYLNQLAQYVPSAGNIKRYAELVRERSILRKLIAVGDQISGIHVNKDWTVLQRMEVTKQVETDQGISILGEQKISYNSAHEKVRVIRAYTLQPDGTKDMVTPDRIRTQDDQDDAGNGIYSESKVKVIIFPNVRVNSKTYYLVESQIHTPDFPKQFTWTEYFSPHKKYGQVEVRFSHDASLKINVEGKGMTGGRIYASDKQKSGSVRYSYRYAQEQAYPVEPGMVSYSDFAPQFSASSFTNYTEVAKAYQDRAASKAKVTPEIRELAKKIIGNAESNNEKVKRLYSWVARNIRYLGIYAGSGG